MAKTYEQVAASGDVPALGFVEDCIAWAAQHGYCGAERAARQLGNLTGRVMWEDQPYYDAWTWRNETEREHDERMCALAEAYSESQTL